MVHPYNSIDTAWKKSYLTLSDTSKVYMIENLLIEVHDITWRIPKSLSIVKEIAYETSHLPPLKYRLYKRLCNLSRTIVGNQSEHTRHTTLGSVLGSKYKHKRDIIRFHTQQAV